MISGHGLLATILLRLGRASDAAAIVARAAELPSGIADAYDGLAYVSTALGCHEQANALYRRATELAPEPPAVTLRNCSPIEPVPWPIIGAVLIIATDSVRNAKCNPIELISFVARYCCSSSIEA